MQSFCCVRDCAAQLMLIYITIKIEGSIKAHSNTAATTLLSTSCIILIAST